MLCVSQKRMTYETLRAGFERLEKGPLWDTFFSVIAYPARADFSMLR
jgi:hypothetical protein